MSPSTDIVTCKLCQKCDTESKRVNIYSILILIRLLLCLISPLYKGTLRCNITKNGQPISVTKTERDQAPRRTGSIKTKVGMPWCTGRLKAFFLKGTIEGVHEFHQEEHDGSIKGILIKYRQKYP